MESIKMSGKTGPDGVLHLSVPLETPDAEYDVLVYYHRRVTDRPPGNEQLYGSITDETFFGPEESRSEGQSGS